MPRKTLLLLVASVLFSSLPAYGQELLDILDDLNKGKQELDLARISASHLTYVRTWNGVRPARPAKDDTNTYHWAVSREFVTPLDGKPVETLVIVPEKAEYRVYLRHVLDAHRTRPVTLRLTPIKPPGTTLSHQFGTVKLISGASGKAQEAKLPIRVESNLQLNTLLDPQIPAWEFWDVTLQQGTYRVSLESRSQHAQVDAVLFTQSKTYRPSFSYLAKDNTLQRIFMRFRLKNVSSTPKTYSVSAGLTYHWRGRLTRGGEVMWGHPIGAERDIPIESWSPFIDATEAIVPGPGAWSTCRVNFTNITDGEVEVQFAWYPHESAVRHTLLAAIGQGRAMFRVPHGSPQYLAPSDQPRWGIWEKDHLQGSLPEAQLVERYFQWAEEAAEELGLDEDHPTPKKLLFLSSCRVGPAHKKRASEMLAQLGVNWIEGAPPEVSKQLGLYADERGKKVKIGDEIATYTPADAINQNPPQLAAFHRYLDTQAELQGSSVQELFGASHVSQLRCLDSMPDNPGRYERRLYYHSHRFCHVATIDRYADALRRAEEKTPNAIVYNNYSPHPIFLTGRSMNTTDWFLLSRARAQTLGWGEDWATNGSWGLGTDRTQCVSFYAALVDCAVRKHGYPSGFYVGANVGNSANKIFSCVGEGIDIMHLYDWGPIDAWAEGSNAWSESQSQYKSIMTATHALGPADELIAEGEREPRRTAVLYNRAHEIMNEATVRLNHDWMWAFIAMKSAQIPVDVIIEEDLTPEELNNYDVLYLGGLNLEARHLRAVSEWVSNGGLLIGTGGSAMFDAYNDTNPATEELFGARSILISSAIASNDETVSFPASEFFPERTFNVAAPNGHRYALKTTTAQPLASYANGETACVTKEFGSGRTILFGFYPGYSFRSGGRALGPLQAWFTQPILAHLGRQRVEFSFPASEATLFEHPSGIAVTLANFSPWGMDHSQEPTKLSIATDREITEVVSGLRGPLPWKRVGNRIEIETPSPADLLVDTIILRTIVSR